MTLPARIDKNQVPDCRRTPSLVLSVFFKDASPLVTWRSYRPPPFSLRALFHEGQETRVLLQIIGEPGTIADDMIPYYDPYEIPPGLQPLVRNILNRVDAHFGIRTELEFVNFESQDQLHPDEVALMTPERQMVKWGLQEIEATFPDKIPLNGVSNHHLLTLADVDEIEYLGPQ
jgi:hypothetical protein